jgi:hypothetical protein
MGCNRWPALVVAAVLANGPGIGVARAQVADPGARVSHDLPRIRKELARPVSGIEWALPSGTPMFRVDIEERLPDIATWLGDPQGLRGGPMSFPSYHDEFLRMVTPPEVGAAYSNGELLQVLATGLAFGFALQQAANAVKAIRSGVASSRSRQACEEVAATLADLNLERAKAGLPPVPVPGC